MKQCLSEWKIFSLTVFIILFLFSIISIRSYTVNNQELHNEVKTLKTIIPKFDARLCKLENNIGIGNASYQNFLTDLKSGNYENAQKQFNSLPETLTEVEYQQRVENHGLNNYNLVDKSYIFPVDIKDAFIISEFGKRDYLPEPNHVGIDLANNKKTGIKCPKQGRVLKCGYDKEDGYYVFIEHAKDERSYMCHALNQFDVKVNQVVQQKEDIGTIGATGNKLKVSGRHLHWTPLKRINGIWQAVNPVKDSSYNKVVKNYAWWDSRGNVHFY